MSSDQIGLVDGARTPIGSFGKSLKEVPALSLKPWSDVRDDLVWF